MKVQLDESHCRVSPLTPAPYPPAWLPSDTGDTPSLEVPEEALKEIKQAKGQVFEMSSEPMW